LNPETSPISTATSNGTGSGTSTTKTSSDRKTWEEWLSDGQQAFAEVHPDADQRRRDAAEVYLARGIEVYQRRCPSLLALNTKPKHLQ
jgi:hypothetical protein